MSDEVKQCRSHSPEDHPCTKPRGHKKRHASPNAKAEWTDGQRVKASWYYYDNGNMSEGEYQAYGRFGY